jgi:hypothetical protein
MTIVGKDHNEKGSDSSHEIAESLQPQNEEEEGYYGKVKP